MSEKEIILTAKEAGFMTYEDGEKMVLNPGLSKFARLIEGMVRGEGKSQKERIVPRSDPPGPMVA